MKNYISYLFLLGLLLLNSQAAAVDYYLPDMNGKTQSLDQYLGKWVVVNYWATWCASCIKELPDLAALHEQNKDSNIVVVGINYEEIDNQQLKGFVRAYDIPYPIWRSKELPVTPLGSVPALPTTYIINPEGKVVAAEVGVITRKNIEDYISQQKLQKDLVKHTLNQSD